MAIRAECMALMISTGCTLRALPLAGPSQRQIDCSAFYDKFDAGDSGRFLESGLEHYFWIRAQGQPTHEAFALFGADREGDLQATALGFDQRAVGELGVEGFEVGV